MNGYLLTIAVLVVTAGRLGDMFGRKRVFIAGMVVFAVGSVVSGAAGDQVGLIVGRVLQGAGAAPMLSLSLALVCNAFPVGGAAAGAGDLGGGLGGGAGDRAAGRRGADRNRLAGDLLDEPAGGGDRGRDHGDRAPESTDPGAGTRIDWAGLAALTVGITAAVLALVQSNAWDAELTAGLALVGIVGAGWPSGGSSGGSRTRSSTSRSSATGPTSAPAPRPSPWSAPTGR